MYLLLYLQLLRKNPLRRLGHGTDDYQELKNQKFWKHINWDFDGLMTRSIKPPFKPELVRFPVLLLVFQNRLFNAVNI